MSVRPAILMDLPALIALGREMHAEAPALRHAHYDETKVGAMLTAAITGGGVFLHVSAAGEIDGAFVGIIADRWFSSDRMATDVALFVKPTARGGLIACRLIDAFLKWCEGSGIPAQDVVIGITTGTQIDTTGAFYERLGFHRIGGSYQLGAY